MIIRSETPSDHDAIRDILIAGFANHPHSRQTEHLIVDALRAAGALTASLVAVVNGDVVGHVAFSAVSIDEQDLGWLALGPVAVLPAFQNQGIGRALIDQGLETIRKQKARGCVVVGDPDFYERFGFRHNSSLRMEGVPPEVFMCLPMDEQVPAGHMTHHEAFSI